MHSGSAEAIKLAITAVKSQAKLQLKGAQGLVGFF